MKRVNPKLVQLIELMQDGHYHDGTSLGDALHITRAAVWKYIKRLMDYQISIEANKGQGYRLTQPLCLLDPVKVTEKLNQKNIHLEIFERIDSTNDYLKQKIVEDEVAYACLAESQTQGRGRLSRAWFSPFGKNIYCSIKSNFACDISELSGLSLAMGLAVRDAIASSPALVQDAWVKWPNDIIIDDKKIAGILLDIQAESNGFCSVIIGVGINVNMMGDQSAIDRPWASLQQLTGQYHDRNDLSAQLMAHVLQALTQFQAHGLSGCLPSWRRHDYLRDKLITLNSGSSHISGTCLGINEQGHLLLLTDDGNTRAFSSGDTSVMR